MRKSIEERKIERIAQEEELTRKKKILTRKGKKEKATKDLEREKQKNCRERSG